MNVAICGYGGGALGRNPFHWMDFLRQVPHGAVTTFWSSMRGQASLSAMAIVLGQHVRVGNEDNLWGRDKKRRTSVQQVEGAVCICEEFGRKVATAEEPREIMKVGVWHNSIEGTLMNLGLQPNRRDGEMGFLVWDTDGEKTVAEVAGDSHPIAYCMAPPDAAKAAMEAYKAAQAKVPA